MVRKRLRVRVPPSAPYSMQLIKKFTFLYMSGVIAGLSAMYAFHCSLLQACIVAALIEIAAALLFDLFFKEGQ